jgi:hypothetical protein
MPDAKPGVIDAAQRVVVLAFDLVDAEITNMPGQIVKALQSPQIQDAIKKTLMGFAKSQGKASSTVISDEDAKKFLESLRTGAKDAATKALLDQVKNTHEYRMLEGSLEAFKKAAASTSLGIWVDKHRKVLYIVGTCLGLGTAAVLYITKSGGPLLTKALEPLKDHEFEVLTIGKLTIKTSMWDFQPDARIAGAKIHGTGNWERVNVDVKLGILAQGTQVQAAEGEAVVKSGGFLVTLNGGIKPQVHQVNLGLKFGYDGVVGNGKFNLGVGVIYKEDTVNGTLGATLKTKDITYGLQGNIGSKAGGGVQYGGLLTLTVAL